MIEILIKLLQLYLERITSKDKTGKFMTGSSNSVLSGHVFLKPLGN